MSRLTVRIEKAVPGFSLDTGWDVRAGFTVLFGYSGAGKSLTLGMLTGTVRPDAGIIRLGERVFVDTAAGVWVPPQARRIGYVPQSGELFPHLSVRRNVEYGLRDMSRAERAERSSELLAKLHVEHLADKMPRHISGGERQRVALARALAPRPDLLVLDEPLSALDLPVRVEIRALLRELQRSEGIPVVMVTHDLYEACSLADTLVVYSGTGVVQVGSPRELVRDPGTPEIRRLLRSIELPDAVFDRN